MTNTAGSVNGGGAPWQLWLATPAAAGRFDPAAQSVEDKRRWSRMGARGPRVEWAVSRALLAHVQPAGSTRSLSHSGGFAALALAPAGSRIGLDIEQVDERRDCLRLARFAFAPEESAQLEVLDERSRREHFYVRWTLKEACIKAFGLTLLEGLRRCVFALEDGQWCARVPPASSTWEARVYRPRPSLYLATLSIPPAPELTQHEWPRMTETPWLLAARVRGG